MPLLGPTGSIISTADWDDLAVKLIKGDGYGWPGDPRLELQIGVLKNKRTGKEGRRLEVWRHNEDGTDTRIGHWLPTEAFQVCYDLARMSLNSRGHVNSVDSIEAHNDKLEKAASDKNIEIMTETMKHALWATERDNDPGAPKLHTF